MNLCHTASDTDIFGLAVVDGLSAQYMSLEVTLDRSAVPSELSHHLNCLTVIPEALGHLNPHTFYSYL